MRKSLITPTRQSDRNSDRGWLVLDEVASVEVTSEAADFPVEEALTGNGQQGWRADTPGSQTIRLRFDSSTHHRQFASFAWCSGKSSLPVLRSSCCDGVPLTERIGGMSSGNNGISARRILYWNGRSTTLTSL